MTVTDEALWLAAAILAIAVLYSSVGHGGASGYLAAMALFGTPPEIMRPTALALNILVSTLGTFHFARAGWLRWRLFGPFAATSIPFAALGGTFVLPGDLYRRAVGAVLLYAAWSLFRSAARPPAHLAGPPRLAVALPVGAGIGLLAGLTGVGGGIFLSPLLLTARWGGARETAAVSAAFILANSAAGLAGRYATAGEAARLPEGLPLLAAAALVGGWAGSRLGSRRLGGPAIRRLLALVLILAGVKFLLLI